LPDRKRKKLANPQLVENWLAEVYESNKITRLAKKLLAHKDFAFYLLQDNQADWPSTEARNAALTILGSVVESEGLSLDRIIREADSQYAMTHGTDVEAKEA